MSDVDHMPIADSQNNGEGLPPLSAPQLPKSAHAHPESNVGLAGPIVIASWQKNSRETLQIKLDDFKGQAVIDCRAWYADKDGELKPGRGGLTVSVKHLPALSAGLAAALKTAMAAGLISEGGET
jgi:hypothetical protein